MRQLEGDARTPGHERRTFDRACPRWPSHIGHRIGDGRRATPSRSSAARRSRTTLGAGGNDVERNDPDAPPRLAREHAHEVGVVIGVSGWSRMAESVSRLVADEQVPLIDGAARSSGKAGQKIAQPPRERNACGSASVTGPTSPPGVESKVEQQLPGSAGRRFARSHAGRPATARRHPRRSCATSARRRPRRRRARKLCRGHADLSARRACRRSSAGQPPHRWRRSGHRRSTPISIEGLRYRNSLQTHRQRRHVGDQQHHREGRRHQRPQGLA